MSEKLRVYIAGPYSSDPVDGTRRAMEVWHSLADHGFMPFCPHLSHYLHKMQSRPYEEWLEYDFVWLKFCDAVVRLPGLSPGADREVEFAERHGIPVVWWNELNVARTIELLGESRTQRNESLPSGERKQFPSGAVRSSDCDSVAYDLVSPIGLRRVAETCAEGAGKYGDYNWEKGMPVREMLNHAVSHIYQYLAGDRSEDHLAHCAWNAMAAMHSEECWPELNDGQLRSRGCKAPETEKSSKVT